MAKNILAKPRRLVVRVQSLEYPLESEKVDLNQHIKYITIYELMP